MDRSFPADHLASSGVTLPENGIYFGTVTHKRLRPVPHELRYDVASLFVDVDQLGTKAIPTMLRYNRGGLISIHDKDHGLNARQSIKDFAWSLVREHGAAPHTRKIYMLCYPRMLGYGFNPLTTYYAVDGFGQLRMVIYEVHNTFGGRHVYHTQLITDGGASSHSQKLFRVSPFNKVEGEYLLRATPPLEKLSLGVALSTPEGPLLKAYFQGTRQPLTNKMLLGLLVRMPFMTFKVIAGIHWEALKLWRKGLKVYGA